MLYYTSYNARVKGSLVATSSSPGSSLRSVLCSLKVATAVLDSIVSARVVPRVNTTPGYNISINAEVPVGTVPSGRPTAPLC